MPHPAQQLLDLQTLDAEMGRLTRQLEQVEAALGNQLKARAAELAIRQAEQALHARRTAQRDREHELSSLESRIKDHEEQLYSGKGSSRELRALQRDVEHDRLRQGEVEAQTLAAMERTEAAGVELGRIKAAVTRVLDEVSVGNAKLAQERAKLQAELERRTAQRVQAISSIDPAARALYDRLRQRLPDGVAVAEIIQARCTGCRTTLPSAEAQRARGAPGIVQCSVCTRILHVPLG